MKLSRFLGSAPFFAGLSPWELERLRSAMVAAHWPAGQTIVTEGRAADALHLIVEGSVAVMRCGPTNANVFVKMARPGDVLGYVSLLDGRPQETSAVAVNEVVTAYLPTETFKALQDTCSPLGCQLLYCLFRHLEEELLDRQLDIRAEVQRAMASEAS